MPGPAMPNVPSRRNVKALTDAIASLESGTPVSAVFVTKRYGAFTIEGTAFVSASVKTLTVGGRSIEQNLKPHKSLQVLITDGNDAAEPVDIADTDTELVADAEPTTGAVTLDDASTPAPIVTATDAPLQHGDLVSAVLIDPAYGRFTVTGVAVASTVSDVVLVGGWFLSQSGARAPRVNELTVLAASGSHEYPLPPRIASWGEEAEGATEY